MSNEKGAEDVLCCQKRAKVVNAASNVPYACLDESATGIFTSFPNEHELLYVASRSSRRREWVFCCGPCHGGLNWVT